MAERRNGTRPPRKCINLDLEAFAAELERLVKWIEAQRKQLENPRA